jgi:hypothetical protein
MRRRWTISLKKEECRICTEPVQLLAIQNKMLNNDKYNQY